MYAENYNSPTAKRDAWINHLCHVPRSHSLLKRDIDKAILRYATWHPRKRSWPGRPRKDELPTFGTTAELRAHLLHVFPKDKSELDYWTVILGFALGCLHDPPQKRGPRPTLHRKPKTRGRPRRDDLAALAILEYRQGLKFGRSWQTQTERMLAALKRDAKEVREERLKRDAKEVREERLTRVAQRLTHSLARSKRRIKDVLDATEGASYSAREKRGRRYIAKIIHK